VVVVELAARVEWVFVMALVVQLELKASSRSGDTAHG
jgi:hypothetical protein